MSKTQSLPQRDSWVTGNRTEITNRADRGNARGVYKVL